MMRHHLALSLACCLGLSFAWLALQARTGPVPPVSGFVAVRALAHVRALARAPRPVGSEANAQARRYLVERIRALGLEPDIDTETVQTASSDLTANVRVSLAVVHNVLVRKPGSGARGRPALIVSAHYDSATASLGAADGAMSAAALLEALRVLQAGAPLDNDLLFVFTDGDDAQAFGTRGFAAHHPWMRRARVILRFDNLGNRGPLELVDASHADAFAINAWADAAPDAHGSTFMAELTRDLPQRAAPALLARGGSGDGGGDGGAVVLQFATMEGTLGPDGRYDLPERLSHASLQQEGDTMLALLRRFGNAQLSPASDAASGMAHGEVVETLPGVGSLHYGDAWTWPLAGLACALSVLACVRALRMGVAGADIAHAAFGFGFMTALATFITYLCHESLPGLQDRYAAGLLAAHAGVDWQLRAFLLLPAAVFIVLQRRLQHKLGVETAALGAILAVNGVLLVACAGAPGATLVLAWPLLAAQAAWLASASPRAHAWRPAWRTALALAGALPALAMLLPAAHASLSYLSPQWLVLPAGLVCAAVGLAGMAFALLVRRFVARALLLASAVCLGLAWADPPPPPALPAANLLVYFKDTPSWQAYWMYPPLPLDAWTRRLFPNTMHPYLLPYMFGVTSKPVWYATAPRDDAIAWPDLLIEQDRRNGTRRHVEFRLRSKNRAPEIVLRLVGADTLRTSVNGTILTDRLYRGWRLELHGMQDQVLHFAIDLPGDPGFQIFVQERIPGLPARDVPARPAGTRPVLLAQTGTTVSSDVLNFP